jgi:hypothetical protein
MDSQSKTQRNPPFQVIESEEYAEQLGELVADPRLRDDLQQTFDLDLSRNPSLFQIVPGTQLRAVTLACVTPLTLFFSVDWKKRIIILLEIHPL